MVYCSLCFVVHSVRILSQYGERSRSPVFGRVINREPLIPQGVTIGYHQRHYDVDSVGSVHGAEAKSTSTYHSAGGSNSSSGSRRPSKYRYVGANGLAVNGAIGSNTSPVNVQGSFQRLKELIWTERAKELTQQRRAEELSARAAVLKEIANGQNIQSSYKHPVKSDSPLMDENRSPDRDIYQHLNDGRMSIATGQSRYIENNYSNKKNSNSNINSNNNNSSNRRKNSRSGYNNKLNYRSNGKTTKSNNKATNRNNSEHNDSYMKSSFDGPAKSSLHSYMIKTKNQNNKNFGKQKSFPFLSFDNAESSATTSLTGSSFNDEHSLGILRSYPMRTSHFRERNRAVLKEDLPLEKNLETDYFSRATRLQPQVDVSSKEALLLEGIIRDLNGHTSTSVITPEYMEHFIMSKSRTEKEAAPAMFADVFALPSSLNIAFSKNTEKVADASVIEDPIKTNAFISYAKPQVRNSAKETGGPVELYEYGTPY
ncbi:probable cyclin-dependent serine/threonine-protein kinase DDB_G0292550 [Anastrepha ludens]|uniref:probable cyclin-dependent serine/threonine-protein kinase DDB_G0292550 n=1 Tax=Anastrepha ludens TaxID=28586 RepID=UPI0023B1652F|nr:probable cyclin-dependent serine/threonine-protein kinase DDB_G0292550 [Anastrepha ludens]